MWEAVENLWGAVRDRFRTQQKQLRAEARLLQAEALQLGVSFWEGIDGLPFQPLRTAFTPVRTQFYGHGAFMGAGPALLADRTWRRILGFLMPDVFEAVKACLAADPDPGRMIPMLENNPVLAAFGTLRATLTTRTDEAPNHLAGMEWDVFVDHRLLDDWSAARTDPDALAAVMKRALDTALVAHAGASDTVQESLGVCQYDDVRRTPKTAFGGVEMDAWVDLFGRALYLATVPDLDRAVAEMAAEARSPSEEACMVHTFATPWSMPRVVELHRRITGRPWLSIVVDIKSLRSTPAFLADLVRELNRRGVHVAAVGSFLHEELDGVGLTAQSVGGRELPGPREVLFFHYAGDLQAACDAGLVRAGQSVMFNGASLLDCVTRGEGEHVYSARLGVLEDLERYRQRHQLEVGFYVQEGDCEASAAAVLSDITDARPDTFALGFAWGGLRDEAGLPAAGEPRAGYGSQRLLEYVGKARQWEVGR